MSRDIIEHNIGNFLELESSEILTVYAGEARIRVKIGHLTSSMALNRYCVWGYRHCS